MTICACGDFGCPAGGGGYYVTCYDGPSRFVALYGPCETHEDALRMVEPCRRLAIERDPWSHFYAFGTCRLNHTYRTPGKFNGDLVCPAPAPASSIPTGSSSPAPSATS